MEKELKGMCGSVSNYILAMTCRLALHLHELPGGAPLATSQFTAPVCVPFQLSKGTIKTTLTKPNFIYSFHCLLLHNVPHRKRTNNCVLAFWWMTFPGVMHLTSDDEITAKLSNSSHLTPDATHPPRTHPASLPADNTPSLQLISVCGWYSLGTCNPVHCMQIYSSSSGLSLSGSFWIHCMKKTFRLTQYPGSLNQLSFQHVLLSSGTVCCQYFVPTHDYDCSNE